MDAVQATSAALVNLSAPSPSSPGDAVQNRELSRAVKTLNDTSYFGQDNEVVFAFDKDSRQPIVRVIDSSTKDVIRQIPPKYVIEVAKEIDRQTRRDR